MTTMNLFRNSETVETFSAGQEIFREGEPGEVMYFVQEGEVEIRIGDELIDVERQGGILGEMALIEHKPRSASAIARSDCKLVPIAEKQFTFLVQETPFFALQVMRVMANRLRRQDEVHFHR